LATSCAMKSARVLSPLVVFSFSANGVRPN
jgi:hypothetical protein